MYARHHTRELSTRAHLNRTQIDISALAATSKCRLSLCTDYGLWLGISSYCHLFTAVVYSLFLHEMDVSIECDLHVKGWSTTLPHKLAILNLKTHPSIFDSGPRRWVWITLLGWRC